MDLILWPSDDTSYPTDPYTKIVADCNRTLAHLRWHHETRGLHVVHSWVANKVHELWPELRLQIATDNQYFKNQFKDLDVIQDWVDVCWGPEPYAVAYKVQLAQTRRRVPRNHRIWADLQEGQ